LRWSFFPPQLNHKVHPSAPLLTPVMGAGVPCTDFLDAYPFLAFAMPLSRTIARATSFHPVYANNAYRAFFIPYQPASDRQEFMFVESLESASELGKLSSWLLDSLSDREPSSVVLRFRPAWLGSKRPSLGLEITCTRLREFWLCTTVPRTPFVRPRPPSPPDKKPLRLTNLPSPSLSSEILLKSIRRADEDTTPTIDTPLSGLEPPSERINEINTLMETYPWHLTPLGPRDKWLQSLRTALSICLSSPFVVRVKILCLVSAHSSHSSGRLPFGGVQNWSSYTMPRMPRCLATSILASLVKRAKLRGEKSGVP
jgi:hypothetical protein